MRVICRTPAVSQPHHVKDLIFREAPVTGWCSGLPTCPVDHGSNKVKVVGLILPLAT